MELYADKHIWKISEKISEKMLKMEVFSRGVVAVRDFNQHFSL